MYKLQLKNIIISSREAKLTHKLEIMVFPKDRIKNPYIKLIDDIFDLYDLLNNEDNNYCLAFGDFPGTQTSVHISDIEDLNIIRGDYNQGWETVKKRG